MVLDLHVFLLLIAILPQVALGQQHYGNNDHRERPGTQSHQGDSGSILNQDYAGSAQSQKSLKGQGPEITQRLHGTAPPQGYSGVVSKSGSIGSLTQAPSSVSNNQPYYSQPSKVDSLNQMGVPAQLATYLPSHALQSTATSLTLQGRPVTYGSANTGVPQEAILQSIYIPGMTDAGKTNNFSGSNVANSIFSRTLSQPNVLASKTTPNFNNLNANLPNQQILAKNNNNGLNAISGDFKIARSQADSSLLASNST